MNRLLLPALAMCALGVSASPAEPALSDPSLFIRTEINSGNPNIPFPQFRKYSHGMNLADRNAEGVTHADMEKAMREAYVMMTHRCRYDSTTAGGVRYITYNSQEVPGGVGLNCAEGDGYALLASAIFADQPTFNGLYMWIHDNRFRNVRRFKDGSVLKGKDYYLTPYLAGWDITGEDDDAKSSASDSDADIAMALLIACKQWGNIMMNNGEPVMDADGNPISLYDEANNVIAAMADTTRVQYFDSPWHTIYSGDIGMDGYVKGGDTFGELTQWSSFAGSGLDIDPNSEFVLSGTNFDYSDNIAPAYYNEFCRWFTDGDGKGSPRNSEWVRSQFRRAAASSNWLNAQAYDQGLYPSLGRHQFDADGKPVFYNYTAGSDFRYPWRNMLDYIWHGNADCDWNPATHQVVEGSNTSQHDMGIRYAEILKYPLDTKGGVACSKLGYSPDAAQPKWQGVCQNVQCVDMHGLPFDISPVKLNYAIGAGAVAAVISEDHDLIADIYRQCEIMWDDSYFEFADDEANYEGSTPRYLQDWFRLLGMLTCSGNLIAPSEMDRESNVKVYLSTDRTSAYVGDTVTYSVTVRNYGAADAENVTVRTGIDKSIKVVAVEGGSASGADVLAWSVGTLPGFKSGRLDESVRTLTFKAVVTDTMNRHIALKSTALVGGDEVWTSNEYPNNATYTMQRNIVDVMASPLHAGRSVTDANSEQTNKRTIEFSILNTKNAEWLDGGRDNVRLSYAEYSPFNYDYRKYKYFRFWNDAQEAYINLGNYRVSYYLGDSLAAKGLKVVLDNCRDLVKFGWMKEESDSVDFFVEPIDSANSRVVMRFMDVLSSPTSHVLSFLDYRQAIHKGGLGHFFARMRFQNSEYNTLKYPDADMSGESDWSYSPQAVLKYLDGQSETYTLVSPCWADLNNRGYMVDSYSRNICDDTPDKFVEKILVEEFDGYTWRRVLGNAPVNGSQQRNVVYADTIPSSLVFEGFVGEHDGAEFIASKDGKNGGVVVWTCSSMGIGAEKTVRYQVSPASEGKISADIKSSLSASGIPTQYSKLNVEIGGVNSGIESVASVNSLVDVVSTSGVVLRKGVERETALKGLPVGVYVVGTEKVVKSSADR